MCLRCGTTSFPWSHEWDSSMQLFLLRQGEHNNHGIMSCVPEDNMSKRADYTNLKYREVLQNSVGKFWCLNPAQLVDKLDHHLTPCMAHRVNIDVSVYDHACDQRERERERNVWVPTRLPTRYGIDKRKRKHVLLDKRTSLSHACQR